MGCLIGAVCLTVGCILLVNVGLWTWTGVATVGGIALVVIGFFAVISDVT